MGTILGERSNPNQLPTTEVLPPIRNRFRFLYQWHPHRWMFNEDDYDHPHGDGWLPSLGKLNITPGAGGVRDGNNLDLALVQASKMKWTVIPEDHAKLGKYKGYTKRFPSRGRTPVWGSMFESVNLLGGKVIWKHDDESYRRFLRHLLQQGIVAPMDPDVRDMMIDDLRTQVEKMEGRLAVNPQNPALAARITAKKRILSKMDGTFQKEGKK